MSVIHLLTLDQKNVLMDLSLALSFFMKEFLFLVCITASNLKVKSFSHSDGIVVFFNNIDRPQSAARIVGSVVVQNWSISNE